MGHKDYHYVLINRAMQRLDAISQIEGGLGNQASFEEVNAHLTSAIGRLVQVRNERLGIE